MTEFKKTWTAQTQIIGTSDGYVTLSGTTESFSSGVDLETNGYEGAHITVDPDFDATPTDDIDVSLYGSLDGSNWDDIPIWTQRIPRATDPGQISVVVKDLAHFRVGAKQTGSTNSHDVRAYYQAWRWASV